MAKKSVKNKKPVMRLLDRRMGKPVRLASARARGGLFVPKNPSWAYQ